MECWKHPEQTLFSNIRILSLVASLFLVPAMCMFSSNTLTTTPLQCILKSVRMTMIWYRNHRKNSIKFLDLKSLLVWRGGVWCAKPIICCDCCLQVRGSSQPGGERGSTLELLNNWSVTYVCIRMHSNTFVTCNIGAYSNNDDAAACRQGFGTGIY